MPQFEMSFFSKCLEGQTHVTIILPLGVEYEETIAAGEKFETLWLLHGGGGNCSEWQRMTSLERLCLNHRIAAVMPEVGMSFYNDVPGGPKYFTYVTEELPALLRKYFPLSDKREDNYIAGLSMGGFGASKCAFNYPERYAAVGLMSTGPISPKQFNDITINLSKEGVKTSTAPTLSFDRIFGGIDKIPKSINDTWWVLENAVKAGADLPKIYDCCGTEDFGYRGFLAFKEFASKLGIEVTYAEGPGAHNWDFWDEYLSKFFDWLPLKHRDYWMNYLIETGSAMGPQSNNDLR